MKIFIKFLVSFFSLIVFVILSHLITSINPDVFTLFLPLAGLLVLLLIFWLHKLIDNYNSVSNQSSDGNYPLSTTPPRTKGYCLCKFIWERTIIFCKEVSDHHTLASCVYIWTSLFYVVAKAIRRQDTVDSIYLHFKEAASDFLDPNSDKEKILNYIQNQYHQFRSVLNESNIDPRTSEGMRSLWSLTAIHAFSDCNTDINYESFVYNVKLVIDQAANLYQFKPPFKESFLMKASNNMSVRVPFDKLDSWHSEQTKIKNSSDPCQLTEKEKQAVDEIIRRIYGPKSPGGNNE